MASLKGILKAGFPFISAGLSLAGGPIAGAAANALGQVLGISKQNPSVDDLDAAFAKIPPDQLPGVIQSMKAAEQNYQQNMTQMGYTDAETLAKIDEQDRESARNREVALKDKFWTPLTFIALLFIFGYFLTLYWVCVHGVAAANAELAHELVIALTLAVGAIINYYFGSSHSQTASTQALADIAKS
jgi:cation transport ATPase